MGKKKSQLIGYKYFLGLHMIICHSVDRLLRIDAGEKEVISGTWNANTSISINKPDLFGGDKKEGGIVADCDLMFGGSTQPKNAYLISMLGSIIPAYRGVLSVVVKRGYLAAMSPYIKAWAFLVERIPGKNWYPAKANINNGSANGAHIIYDCFTDQNWGMGYTESAIDLPSFIAAADTLYAEGLGMSFFLTKTDSIENFITEVCRHIAAVIYTKPTDGKFVLNLLRDDYDVNTLKQFDESNIISLEQYEKPAPAEMVNEVVATFRPRGTGKDDSVTLQDLASIQSQQGIISTTLQFPGIDTHDSAARAAARELRIKSTPLTRVKFTCNRTGWDVQIGKCIRFSWAAHRVSNLVVRVTGINFGNLDASEITISGIEDVFGLPFATYLQPQSSDWVDPIQPPSQLLRRYVREASYWDIARTATESDLASLDSTSSFLLAAAGQPAQASSNFELWDRPNTGSYVHRDESPYSTVATTATGANKTQTTIAIGSISGSLSTIGAGTYGIWDNELVRFDSYNSGTGILTIGRGVIDTVATTHATNSVIAFIEENQAIDETEYASGQVMNAKLLMRTPSDLFPIASAIADNVTFVGRFARPYPPGNFLVNGARPPLDALDVYGAGWTINWAHRNRLQQLASLISQETGSIGPEAGTTYSLRITNADTNTVLQTVTGLAGGASINYGTVYEPTYPIQNVKLEVWSVRDGLASYTMQSQIINRHGLGFQLGLELGGVA